MQEHPDLDTDLLSELARFNASLGPMRRVKGIDYVRSIELPILAAELLTRASARLLYLDVGCGDSILPSFVATRSNFTVLALDKFDWIRAQGDYLRRLNREDLLSSSRFTTIEEDFLEAGDLETDTLDLVTAVSVLEHIEGSGDSEAVRKVFALLKPGGRFLLSCPYNRDAPADFRVGRAVYGEEPGAQGAFFQRHYSAETLGQRILEPAPFEVDQLFYAGHYRGPNVYRRLYVLPMVLKPARVLYSWATPLLASRFMRVSTEPPADARPRMLTADTAFVFLRKPA